MIERNRNLLAALALGFAGLGLSGQASAVPCGAYSTYGGIKVQVNGSTVDLGASSSTCKNGGLEDANDSEGDVNAGSGYFGSTTWQQLDKTDDGSIDSSLWSFNPDPTEKLSGQFTLASTVWQEFSQIMVVLKDGGSTLNKDIKWSAYLLPTGVLGPYDWSYDGRKKVSHISFYGIEGGTVSVPEPATLALFALGLFGSVFAYRRAVRQS